jgi:hypothetical protein
MSDRNSALTPEEELIDETDAMADSGAGETIPQPPQDQPPISRQNPNEFVFPKIIDVFAEIQTGNFLPLFKFLKRCQADPTLDPFIYNTQGFNVFHMAVSSGNYEFVKVIIDNFPEFLARKTKPT